MPKKYNVFSLSAEGELVAGRTSASQAGKRKKILLTDEGLCEEWQIFLNDDQGADEVGFAADLVMNARPVLDLGNQANNRLGARLGYNGIILFVDSTILQFPGEPIAEGLDWDVGAEGCRADGTRVSSFASSSRTSSATKTQVVTLTFGDSVLVCDGHGRIRKVTHNRKMPKVSVPQKSDLEKYIRLYERYSRRRANGEAARLWCSRVLEQLGLPPLTAS